MEMRIGDGVFIQVVSTDQIKTQEIEVSPGVKKQVRFLHFTAAGGSSRVQIADGVDVPLDYSGLAVCSAVGRTSSNSTKFGTWTVFNFQPTLLTQFVPDKPVQRFSLNSLQQFMSSVGGSSDPSSRSEKK